MLGSRIITFFLVNLFFLFDGGMDLVGEMRGLVDFMIGMGENPEPRDRDNTNVGDSLCLLEIIGIGEAADSVDLDVGNGAETVEDGDVGEKEDLDIGDAQKLDLEAGDGAQNVDLDVNDVGDRVLDVGDVGEKEHLDVGDSVEKVDVDVGDAIE